MIHKNGGLKSQQKTGKRDGFYILKVLPLAAPIILNNSDIKIKEKLSTIYMNMSGQQDPAIVPG